MARLSESQLAGFRVGTNTPATEQPRPGRGSKEPEPEASTQEPRADQPALALHADSQKFPSALGPVPPAPARAEARHKVGLALPIELAEEVRALIQQGYRPADLVMVAYQQHRDDVVRDRATRTSRELRRRTVGRSSFTVALSAAERDALDVLARRLDTTRSQTVTALLQRHLTATARLQIPTEAAASPPAPRRLP
jgi:hypothetical protein